MAATKKTVKQRERLTTQNLLISAAYFDRDPVTTQTLEDFSKLVDLYCLYDQVVVLGRNFFKTARSPFLEEIQSGVIKVEEVSRDLAGDVAERAAHHVGVALARSLPRKKLEKLMRQTLDHGHALHALTNTPDKPEHVATGRRLLERGSLAKVSAEARAYMFVRRSFVYVAYAEQTGRVFTPDTARVSLLEKIRKEQTIFRDGLLENLGRPPQLIDDVEEPTRVVPALAAIVLDRASPDRRRIASELRRLREELAPVRRRIREAEFWMQSDTADELARRATRWRQVFKELAKDYGVSPYLATLEGLVETVPKIAANPADPGEWLEAMKTLSVEAVQTLISRRPLIELHKLKKHVPGMPRLSKSVTELFGQIKN